MGHFPTHLDALTKKPTARNNATAQIVTASSLLITLSIPVLSRMAIEAKQLDVWSPFAALKTVAFQNPFDKR